MARVKFNLIFGLLLMLIANTIQSQSLEISELHQNNQTFTYAEVVEIYQKLDSAHSNAMMIQIGISDAGYPIHAFFMYPGNDLNEDNLEEIRDSSVLIAINNGIHPGESCGVDASIHFANEYLNADHSSGATELIAIIPMYNIGGSLNRGCCTRTNQDGPVSQGFRGNARNFDLNRDLIKADTRNTFALYELFQRFDPDMFIDTHTTNGADYTYEMTLITSPWQKYPSAMHEIVQDAESTLMSQVKERGTKISPFVNVYGRSPMSGFPLFVEGAMYTTGFAALHNSIAFVTEAHMLKPYYQRVEATKVFFEETLEYSRKRGEEIKAARALAKTEFYDRYVIEWEVDYDKYTTIWFEGYESELVSSNVTTGERLQYSEDVKADSIPYYNYLKPKTTIVLPEYYYIPIGQWPILERFAAVGVEMDTIEYRNIQSWLVERFHIDSYSFASYPYEGHVRMDELDVSLERTFIPDGKYVKISTQQPLSRYLHQALHPLAPSSFARWNFFPAYLQQKEHYSPYVFEDTAEELLERNEELAEAFEQKMEDDEEFANNPSAQLHFIFVNSEYYEDEHMFLPYYLSAENL